MKTPRQAALEALIQMNTHEGYSNIIIDNLIKTEGLKGRDASFVTALVYGVLERQLTLDFIINKYSKMPLKKMTPQVLQILRLSIYQMMYMDSVPDNAAVNEGVAMAKANRVTSASGFINGILRSFQRDGGNLPKLNGSKAYIMSIEHSCPQWLIEKFINEHGVENTEKILTSSQGAPPTYIRVNSLKIHEDALTETLIQEGLTVDKTEVVNCLEIGQSGDITTLKSYKNGLFHVQDMASQICSSQAISKDALRVADMCAAPGGKSFTMAQLMENKGEIVSMDLHKSRVTLIESGAKRLGLTNINATAQDATAYNSQLGEFDVVLCDVPCSGFGIIRRKPEIKYKKCEEIKNLPEIQYKILENSSKYVKVNGVLVYSTCTILNEENSEVVEKFLENHKDYEPYDTKSHCQTFIPNSKGSDGFFISKIRRVK